MWCVFAVRCVPCVRHAVHVGALCGVCGVFVWAPPCSHTQSLFAIALFGHGARALVFTLDAACVRACRGVRRACVPLGHSMMSSVCLCLCAFLCFSVCVCVCVCLHLCLYVWHLPCATHSALRVPALRHTRRRRVLGSVGRRSVWLVRTAPLAVLQLGNGAAHIARAEDGREPLRRVMERLACAAVAVR